MMNRTAMTSMEAIRTWWEADRERPYFTLYRGARATKASDIIVRNDTIEDLEPAWDMLEQMLTINSSEGGEFTVLRTDKPKSNFGMKGVVVLNHAHATPSVAGIPGMPFIGAGQNIQSFIAGEIEKEREKWDLAKKVEDLEAAINAGQEGGPIERFLNRLLDSPKIDGILDVVLSKVFAPPSGAQPSHVAVSGAPGAAADQFQYDTERVAAALERIRAHFPDIHGTMDRLADFIDRNPEMAKSLFNQM